jgi:hypothetical protein
MDSTETGRVDFDTLCGRVLANMPENWIVFTQPHRAQQAR